MVFELPGANKAEDAGFGAALGLLRLGDVAAVPGFIGEDDNEDEVEGTHPEDEPKDGTPGAGTGNDEVAEERAAVGGDEEQPGPEADLAGMFVKEEHVFDEAEANDLAGGQSETHHGAESIEGVEVVGHSAAECEESASDLCPE